ncbi:MAG: hypothetical protein RL026_2556 [Pseudomonadota bacterium]|jgi:hypothetical protein
MRLFGATRHAKAGLLILVGLASAAAIAQEGYPLDGTWRGERRIPGQPAATVVVVMNWDGKEIQGLVNPGPRAYTLAGSSLEPRGWKVMLHGRNKAGDSLRIAGALSKIGEYHRELHGTLVEGGREYPLKLVRE